ncbi:hypothetical protein NIB75_11455 [Bacteroides uniformis]|nr:hypothetical protein [Bacteroides uniformis]
MTTEIIEDKKLSTIREAIKRFFPDFSDLRVRRNPQRYVIQKDSEIIEFNQLSQGEKMLLGFSMRSCTKVRYGQSKQ